MLIACLCASVASAAPTKRLEASAERTMVIQTESRTIGCAADVGLSWTQVRAEAVVDGELRPQDCPVASAEVVVSLRWRDVDGERHAADHVETFEQVGMETVQFESRYDIDPGARLFSVRTRSVRCLCDES